MRLIITDVNLDHFTMGKNLNTEMKIIFAEFTMKGEAHNQLHLYLIRLVKMFRNLKEEENN